MKMRGAMISFKFAFVMIIIGSAVSLTARADPTYAWTGNPSIPSVACAFPDEGPDQGSLGITPTDTGLLISGQCASTFGFGSDVVLSVARAFTVTSPGLFNLSSTATDSFTGSQCMPVHCDFLDSGFSLTISDTITISGPTNFSVSFSDSGSALWEVPGVGFLTLSGGQSGLVNLGVGDYTIEQDYSTVNTNYGDAIATESVVSSLTPFVPTPEPRGAIVVLAVAFVLFSLLRTRFATH